MYFVLFEWYQLICIAVWKCDVKSGSSGINGRNSWYCEYIDDRSKYFETLRSPNIDGLMQGRPNYIANTLALRPSCTNPSIWCMTKIKDEYGYSRRNELKQ